ncbi:MAG: anthranilate synthase component I family protein [Bacteroidales bacterium]
MRETIEINIDNSLLFKKQLLEWGRGQEYFLLLDSHHFAGNTSNNNYHYDFLAAFGQMDHIKADENNGFAELENFLKTKNDWAFGYFTYDLKNEVEALQSLNTANLGFPALYFFQPECVIVSENQSVVLHFLPGKETYTFYADLMERIKNIQPGKPSVISSSVNIQNRFTKEEYLETVTNLKHHIKRGDIYEINFCQEFYDFTSIDPFDVYSRLANISPAPFSCFCKYDDKYILSSSPERFMKKTGNKVFSQPIKGTAKRGDTERQDNELREKLYNDKKEKAENVMIVDLVRNDLSRVALSGSVKVEELFGIYTFEHVHQMISTISCEINPDDYLEVIKKSFPMGSMTGAPKVKAMQLIEKYERTKRGVFSGSVGYFTPEKDFDFNVIIRTILYNSSRNYVSYSVGGAITHLANPQSEFEECNIKSAAMKKVLNN